MLSSTWYLCQLRVSRARLRFVFQVPLKTLSEFLEYSLKLKQEYNRMTNNTGDVYLLHQLRYGSGSIQ